MGKVIILPGVERRDLNYDIKPEDVLTGAIDNGVTSTTVIGIGRDGQFYVASSVDDTDKVVGMLHRAIGVVANGRYASDYPIDLSAEDED